MDHEHQLLSLWPFTCNPVLNCNASFSKCSYCSNAVVKSLFPMKPPNGEQSEWALVLKSAVSKRRELIDRNCRTVDQNLVGWGTESLDRLPHIIGDAMNEIGDLKDSLQSHPSLWVLEGLNLLGRSAAAHSNLRVSMEPRKFIKVRGGDAGEFKMGNV